MNTQKLQKIEAVEFHYLKKYYHFLCSIEDELKSGLKTKESIKNDWYGLYKTGISDFAVGAERIIYSFLNGRGVGQPNSAPVGSDLFFEVEDAFIHIDLKTVGATLNSQDGASGKPWSNNIGDFTNSIFVGPNQNSYRSEIKTAQGSSYNPERIYTPNLPTFYRKSLSNEKICLSYFITILYDRDTLEVLVMTIMSMPNGELESHYGPRVLKAGKTTDEARFNFREVSSFELLQDFPSRIKIIIFDKNMDMKYKKDLKFFEDIYLNQN